MSEQGTPRNAEDAANIKEVIIRRLSQESQIPIATIKAVIENQFKTAEKAIDYCTSIELAGFGKFMMSKRRLEMRLRAFQMGVDRYEELLTSNEELTDMRREGLVTRVASLKKLIIYLKRKQNEFKDK